MKVCEFYKEPEKHEPEYDHTQKYQMVWDVITLNLNFFLKKGGTGITINKTTWPSACYGLVHSRLMKKKTSKGGQHTLAVEAERRYIVGYTVHHTLLEEGVLQASIEQRDDDNANIGENILDTEFNFTKTLPGAPED